MQFSTCRILHDDHAAALSLLAEVARVVLARKSPPAREDQDVARVIARLRAALAHEIAAHFDFEDEALFPLLVQSGDGDLADLLSEEHFVIREAVGELEAQADAAADGFDDKGWTTFRRLCGEIVERLQSHIEKEERALLPALDAALTSELDAELSARHDI